MQGTWIHSVGKNTKNFLNDRVGGAYTRSSCIQLQYFKGPKLSQIKASRCDLIHFLSGAHTSFQNSKQPVGFEVFTAVITNSSVSWNVTSCSPLRVNWCFTGTYRLYFQGLRVSPASNPYEADSKQSHVLVHIYFPETYFFLGYKPPESWEQFRVFLIR
jgi:hypothetical protein